MFGLSLIETLIIGAVLLFVFRNRVPKMMRSLGRGFSEFKQGIAQVSRDIEDTGKPNLRGPDA